MSVQFRMDDQVLRVDDDREGTGARAHRYDAFLNLLCAGRYAFQRDAVRTAWRFLVSDRYPDLERLARENFNANPQIRARHDGDVNRLLARIPLRAKRAVSLDLATGTGKSTVLYALAAIALAEGIVDRVLVLCPSLTIEEGLLEKFTAYAGNAEFAGILRELGAAVAIPGVKRGNGTINPGDICVENFHAVLEKTGSSIRDSFRDRGGRTLVLNDEAHHLFSDADAALKRWIEFLLNPEFGFDRIVNVTGTPYTGNEYFPDVVFRYGLKRAIEDKVVKKPNYKIEDTLVGHTWPKTHAVHENNRTDYGAQVKPLTIVVTQEIVRCVEVWAELVAFLMGKEGITREAAEAKVIWVTSGIPSNAAEKARVLAACPKRADKDSPEKRRTENLSRLRTVDERENPVEWIVSVSMLTEGWDVKNVFQIVPHDSRAFGSKLLIAQVLGRGLRVPVGMEQPLVTINNHQAWRGEIGQLLNDVLEVENTLSWGLQPGREQYVFPLHNLRYEPTLQSVEKQRVRATAPQLAFGPQSRTTTEHSTFSETGALAVRIEHRDLFELEEAVRLLRLFLREKDEAIGTAWPAARLREFIVKGLERAGQDATFLSRANFTHVQQAFGPMFRELGGEHARFSQVAQEIADVDLNEIKRQSFSESTLREHGNVWYVAEDPPKYGGGEKQLWNEYQQALQMAGINANLLSEEKREIAARLHQVELGRFKTPWDLHYASYEPERQFTELLFANADLFAAFVKMPDRGGYAFPYSYKPAQTGRTHTTNENFHPDYFIRRHASEEILVVEVKADGDDANRNRAKCRDGERHFTTLNERLSEAEKPWRYRFYFLSPEDFTAFFTAVREDRHVGWRSTLMQALVPNGVEVE